MTVPTLVSNHQKKVLVNQLKNTYSLLNQTFRSAMATDGVDNLGDTKLFSMWSDCSASQCNGNNMSLFISELNNFIKVELDNSIEYIGSQRPSITLSDGSIIRDYNFSTSTELSVSGIIHNTENTCKKIKALGGNFCNSIGVVTIDVNGNKKPNTAGQDIFRFSISDNGILYPVNGKDYALAIEQTSLETNSYYWKNMSNACAPNEKYEVDYGEYKQTNTKYNTDGCAARIMEEGWQMNY